VRGGGAWHRGWTAYVGRADRPARRDPFQQRGHACSLRWRARGGLDDAVSSHSAGSDMRLHLGWCDVRWLFRGFALVDVWGVPMLLHAGQILCTKVPNNAYSQDSQEFGASAGAY